MFRSLVLAITMALRLIVCQFRDVLPTLVLKCHVAMSRVTYSLLHCHRYFHGFLHSSRAIWHVPRDICVHLNICNNIYRSSLSLVDELINNSIFSHFNSLSLSLPLYTRILNYAFDYTHSISVSVPGS